LQNKLEGTKWEKLIALKEKEEMWKNFGIPKSGGERK